MVAEAGQLAADGVRELVIVAQDTTYYGMDLDGRPRLAELLARLEEVEGVEWIRLMYLYPMHFTDELVDHLAGATKVLPYLDLPLQHVNDKILRRMNRRVTRAETERLVDRLRERIEGLVLRTTMITGFSGRDRGAVRGVGRVRPCSGVSSGWGCLPIRCEPDTPAATVCGTRSRWKWARRGAIG